MTIIEKINQALHRASIKWTMRETLAEGPYSPWYTWSDAKGDVRLKVEHGSSVGELDGEQLEHEDTLRRILGLDQPSTVASGRDLNQLAALAFDIALRSGWWPDDVLKRTRDFEPRQIATALCLIHSEVTEALEAVRHNDRQNFTEELADIVIRILDLAGGMGINIDQAVVDKMNANAKRSHRHGGKRL